MSKLKEEMKDYLKKLIRQFLFVKSLDKQLKLLSDWETPQRVEALNIGSHFFRLINYSFSRTIMIELCQLFSDKEQKSILDFLSKVQKHYSHIKPSKFNPKKQLRERIGKEEYLKIIKEHMDLVDSKKEIIANLKAHRDKSLVHSDSEYFGDLKKLYE